MIYSQNKRERERENVRSFQFRLSYENYDHHAKMILFTVQHEIELQKKMHDVTEPQMGWQFTHKSVKQPSNKTFYQKASETAWTCVKHIIN